MNSEKIEEIREVNKISLESYFLRLKSNTFTDSVNDLISNLSIELEKSIEDYRNGKHNEDVYHSYYFESEFLEEQILAIVEMKVVYLYRNFEIELKKLIKAAYVVNVKDFYKWEAVIDFLKSKNIPIKEIEGYNEVNQLREINNVIKHTIDLKDKNIKIHEFKDLVFMRHNELMEFYNRVEDFPYKFIVSLADKIYLDLYVFDEKKINEISNSIALRMNKKQAELLIENLKSKY